MYLKYFSRTNIFGLLKLFSRYFNCKFSFYYMIVIVVWNGINSWLGTNRTGAKSLFFYYPRLLHCPDQILALMVLSHHQILSSKIIIPWAPSGARCMEHTVSLWSGVYSVVLHLQFDKIIIFHLCMDKWN